MSDGHRAPKAFVIGEPEKKAAPKRQPRASSARRLSPSRKICTPTDDPSFSGFTT